VHAAVDFTHHLIVAQEVTTMGSDRALLSSMVKKTKAVLQTDKLDVVADRGAVVHNISTGPSKSLRLPRHCPKHCNSMARLDQTLEAYTHLCRVLCVEQSQGIEDMKILVMTIELMARMILFTAIIVLTAHYIGQSRWIQTVRQAPRQPQA